MTKLKLPRKQKKALKNIRFTKRWLIDEMNVIMKACRRAGNSTIANAESTRIELLLCNPYPETKWIRKIRNNPFVKYIDKTKCFGTLVRLNDAYIRQQALKAQQMMAEAPANEHEAFEMCNHHFEVDKTILHEGGLLEVVPKQ